MTRRKSYDIPIIHKNSHLDRIIFLENFFHAALAATPKRPTLIIVIEAKKKNIINDR